MTTVFFYRIPCFIRRSVQAELILTAVSSKAMGSESFYNYGGIYYNINIHKALAIVTKRDVKVRKRA